MKEPPILPKPQVVEIHHHYYGRPQQSGSLIGRGIWGFVKGLVITAVIIVGILFLARVGFILSR